MGSSGWGRLQAVAVFGSAAEGLVLAAIPLLAVSVTTNPGAISLVTVAGQAPWLLLSLGAGVVIDRMRRTTVLAGAYVLLTVAAAALAVVGRGSVVALLVVAFAITTAQVFGDGASGAIVPEVVGPERLAAANARLQVIDRGLVQFVVPPATGVLIGVAAGLPAWVACGCGLVAFALAHRMPSGPPRKSNTHPLRDIGEGLRYLVGTRLLRAITITVALGSFAASASNSMFVLYATQILHVGPVGYGGLLACLAVGWVGSSFLVGRIVHRLGYGWSMRLAQSCAVPAQLVIALLPPWPAAVGVVLVFLTATTLVWNVCSQSSRQRFTPSSLLGRVLTSHRALAWGLTPLGALAGGVVAAHVNLRSVWLMSAVVQLAGVVVVWWQLSPSAFRAAEHALMHRTSVEPEQA
ncbi:MAG TPA: MFS transporter [Amycolatopsis sp.]|nr:MFS transporter [Amycolatopsis sp.]